jgi:NADPH2:quinone reductase
MRADLWDAVTAGEYRVPVDRLFPLDDVNGALGHMRANKHFGKVLLIP